jgi:hypothetical protein
LRGGREAAVHTPINLLALNANSPELKCLDPTFDRRTVVYLYYVLQLNIVIICLFFFNRLACWTPDRRVRIRITVRLFPLTSFSSLELRETVPPTSLDNGISTSNSRLLRANNSETLIKSFPPAADASGRWSEQTTTCTQQNSSNKFRRVLLRRAMEYASNGFKTIIAKIYRVQCARASVRFSTSAGRRPCEILDRGLGVLPDHDNQRTTDYCYRQRCCTAVFIARNYINVIKSNVVRHRDISHRKKSYYK